MSELFPNKRLRIDDAIWAGQNVEPRILEVLPAAVLRLEKHFDFDPKVHKELGRVVGQLRRRDHDGDDFHEIPFSKIKIWADLPLLDKRVKTNTAKKIVKTFRLDLNVVERLRQKAAEAECTVTEILERIVLAN